MISDVESWAEDTTHVIPALRAFLWWGIAVRAVLFFALGTLLVVEGNFLAEWLLSWQVVPVEASEVEEYTTIGYVAFVLFLTSGTIARAAILKRLNRSVPSTAPPHPVADPDAGPRPDRDEEGTEEAESAPQVSPNVSAEDVSA